MADEFDPYRKWLGIPPQQQPADHYRLLGIAPFEDDPDVIENAADRQMAHVRTFQTGRHAEWSQKLLNQLATAKICLLDHQRKESYDNSLKAKLPPQPPEIAPPVSTPPVSTPPVSMPPPPVSTFLPVDGSPTAAAVRDSEDDEADDRWSSPSSRDSSGDAPAVLPVGVATRVTQDRPTRVTSRRRRARDRGAGVAWAIALITIVGVIVLFYIVSMLSK